MLLKRLTFYLLFVAFFLTGCQSETEKIKEHLTEFANSLKVVDTHEHQLNPSWFGYREFNFFSLVKNSYLEFDMVSSGSVRMDDSLLKSKSVEQLFDIYADYLRYSSNTTHAKQFLKGINVLYNVELSDFEADKIKNLTTEIANHYENYNTWFDESFHKAGFETMFQDLSPSNFDIDTSHFKLVFNIGQLVSGVRTSKEEADNFFYYEDFKKTMSHDFKIKSLDDYLGYVDFIFLKAREKNVVCLKNNMAYYRSIYYEEFPYTEAVKLFNKAPELSPYEVKCLEDFMFHTIIKKAIEYEYPIQVHTGILAGYGNLLENSDPLLLNTLFVRYPEAKFIIFHVGFPWTGEVISMAKMFPNVYLDLAWLPQISRARAISAFDEMLDCVPYNKIMWGGDSRFIEEAVGSLYSGKEVVIEVLTNRILNKQMSIKIAEEILKRIFRENAIEFFHL